jgi:hypothetical protein
MRDREPYETHWEGSGQPVTVYLVYVDVDTSSLSGRGSTRGLADWHLETGEKLFAVDGKLSTRDGRTITMPKGSKK